MKIIKLPVDTTVTCDNCGCVFEFNFEDISYSKLKAATLDNETVFIKNSMYINCPFCGKKIEVKKEDGEM